MKVLIAGHNGKMGSIAVQTLKKNGYEVIGVGSSDQLSASINVHRPQVMVDLTTPDHVAKHLACALDHQLPIVVGTTGLTQSEIASFESIAKSKEVGVIIAPNFSIGAILMMHCAQIAEHFYDTIDIVEVHHPEKKDQPSGTAIRTAAMLKKTANIHSRRQLGKLADQTVYFGGEGEVLSISHQTSNRECFMPGLLFALKKVVMLDHLVYGLDQLLFPSGANIPENIF